MRNIISDNKLRQPCAKPEDILNASIQVIMRMTFEVLMVSGYRHSMLICDKECHNSKFVIFELLV